MSDKWVKCLVQGGNLTATAIDAKNLVSEARKRHKLDSFSTIALGEALIASLLLSSTGKKEERLSLSVKGSHKLKHAIADSTSNGIVRGYIHCRKEGEIEADYDKTRGAWQTGLLSIVRLKDAQKEPYVGTVENITGHLSKDLTFYLSQSEQIPSAVGIAVNTNKEGEVTSAGGFLIQVLPGASKGEVLMVENNIAELQNLAKSISEDSNPTKLLGQLFQDLTLTLLDEKPLRFECNCSRNRVLRALKMIGPDEIQSMLKEEKQAEILCDFCGKNFTIHELELKNLLSELRA